jgi:hypothetical protein
LGLDESNDFKRKETGVNRTAASLRTALVVGTTAAVAVPVSRAVVPPLTVLGDAAGHGRTGLEAVTLAEAVAGLCATALAGGYAVWVLGLLLALLEALHRGVARAAVRRVPCPDLARALALTALGVSLAAAVPAAADGAHDARRAAPAGHPAPGLGPAALAGLPLPDRVATPVPTRTHAGRPDPHLVVRGDTLWAIAAAALPPGATEAAVDGAWRRIAAANAGVVADPDLIFPGTALRVPPLETLLGKDQP